MQLIELYPRVRVYIDDLAANKIKNETIMASANAIILDLWIRIKTVNPDWAQTSVPLQTVIGSDTVNLPVDYGTFTRLEYTADKVELSEWRWPEDRAIINNQKPWEYRIEATIIRFREKADAIYDLTFWYEKLCPQFTLETDSSPLPDIFDELLCSRVALRLGSKLVNPILLAEEQKTLLGEKTHSRTPVHGYWYSPRYRR